MIQQEELTQLYRREYERAGKIRRTSSIKAKGAAEKTVSLARTLKRLKNSQVTRNALENYHRQANNLLSHP